MANAGGPEGAAAGGAGGKPSGSAAAGDDGDRKPWQVRMDAVAAVQVACEAAEKSGGAVANDAVGALARALKKRLADTQGNIKPRACGALAALARAVGAAAVAPHIKVVGEWCDRWRVWWPQFACVPGTANDSHGD
jgi:hypothetical protein